MAITIPVSFDGDFSKLNRELQAETSKIGRSVGSSLDDGLNRGASGLEANGRRSAGRFGGAFSKGLAGLGAASGVALGGTLVAGFVKSSIGAFADFEQNLNLTEQALGATGEEMKQLSGLAKQLGADTVFSAGEASTSMLELAKSGFTTKQVMAALPQVMNLAATEGLALADASNSVTSAMAQFGIKAENSSTIVNALAGASNASAASVAGISQSLTLVGSAAHSAGLTVQETTGALAALADNGLKGGIAGTSLASVLNHLVPTTKLAQKGMDAMGLTFTKADGSFKSVVNIAGTLQKAFKGLSEEERTIRIGQIFGRDASNIAAVNALINTGAKGLREYVKASSSTDAAQKLADARMKGVAGSLERLSGSWDTLKISVGEALSPLVVKGADALGAGLSGIGPAVKQLGPTFASIGKTLGPLIEDLGPALKDVGDAFTNEVLPAFQEALPVIAPIAKFLLELFGGAVIGTIKGFAKVVSGVFQVISGFFEVFSGILTGDWGKAWQGIKDIAGGALEAILGAIQVWWNLGVLAIFKKGILFLTKDLWVGLWNGLKTGAEAGLGAIRGLIGKALTGLKDLFMGAVNGIKNIFVAAFQGYISLWRGLFDLLKSTVTGGISTILGFFRGIPSALGSVGSKMFTAGKELIGKLFEGIKNAATGGLGFVRSLVTALKNAINNALNLPLEINIDKGPLHIHATVIPAFASGTDFAPGGLALVGEQGPELVNLPRGSRVSTATETREALSKGGDFVYSPQFFGPTTGSERLREMEWIAKFAPRGLASA